MALAITEILVLRCVLKIICLNFGSKKWFLTLPGKQKPLSLGIWFLPTEVLGIRQGQLVGTSHFPYLIILHSSILA